VADEDRARRRTAAKAGGISFGTLIGAVVGVIRFLDRNLDHPPEMVAPADIVVTDAGEIAIADPGAHRVFLVSGDDIDVLAGTGEDGADATAEGAPSEAKPAGDPLGIALGEPRALFVEGDDVYVADRELGAVLRRHDVGGEWRLDPLPGAWQSPQRIAAGSGDELYAVVSPTVAGNGPAELLVGPGSVAGAPRPVEALAALGVEASDVRGLAASRGGTLYYWVDGQGLFSLPPGGTPERLVDATGDERYEVDDIALGDDGDIAVAEPDARRITVFRPDRGVRWQVDLPFPPAAVAFAPDGSLVVLHAHDPDKAFLYRIPADGDGDGDAVEPIGPHAARARAADRLSTATTQPERGT
jgi:hypothetical protein